METFDAIVVGGGPAGLSAALVLGRCRRRTILFDDGKARNGAVRHAHGFFTRDGADPAELRDIGRAQLAPYPVDVVDEEVVDAERGGHDFLVRTARATFRARKLVLATGVVDVVPDVEGFEPLYGTSIWHCPHCDGWENRDAPLGVLARGKDGVDFALGLQTWSADLLLFTHGEDLDDRERARATRHGLAFTSEPIVRLDGDGGRLKRVVLANGDVVARSGLFFHLGVRQRSQLPEKLGCHFDERGFVVPMIQGVETHVPGLYVVGDASIDATLIAVAVAEGAKAAIHINKRLRQEHVPPAG